MKAKLKTSWAYKAGQETIYKLRDNDNATMCVGFRDKKNTKNVKASVATTNNTIK